ncbi:translation elongation factor Tu [Tulasnella sp. 427]|nr:translation elongation factor Tu [Tulasnella sp. 427]
MFSQTCDVTCALTWPENVEDTSKMVMPGDNVEMACTLVHDVPLETGFRFTLRESNKTIGTGVVTKVLEEGTIA